MKTIIIKKPRKKDIKKAGEIIRKGGMVAFPTETVYGLGANALDEEAVQKIFQAKGRPSDNPLIIHIAEKKELYNLAEKVPQKAERLITRFWPGPLTIILKKKSIIPKTTTGGLDTVAVRMPDNKIALALIKESGVPIAAPSANISGKPSPTIVEHVIHDLNGRINMIINGGKTRIGVESTVIDLTQKIPAILRPGYITLKQIKEEIGKARMAKRTSNKSPGMKYRHYAPEAELILIKDKTKIRTILNENENKKISIIKNIHEKNLFRKLREIKAEIIIILINGNMSESVINRLEKAASRIIKK